MSDSEPFLNRWSRRKRDAAQGTERESTERSETPARPDEPRATEIQPAATQPPVTPTVDLDKLPSLDSITAETDLSGFLQPGVPGHVSRAALRRAWSADPAIRDFIGLVENAWDFNDPEGVPGFGPILKDEIARAVAGIFEERSDVPATDPEPQQPTSESAAEPQQTADENDKRQEVPMQSAQDSTLANAGIVQSNNDTAVHNPESESRFSVQHNRRRQGGALPQ